MSAAVIATVRRGSLESSIRPDRKVPIVTELSEALLAPRATVRLRAVMEAGTRADVDDLDVLIGQCAVEPDFFVRDMLTWALTRLPVDPVVAALLAELERPEQQARSQALHTLSKIGDRRAWPQVADHVTDPDDAVARAAWRASVALVPDDEGPELARALARQLGRRNAETRLSLSRALIALGDEVVGPVLSSVAERTRSEQVRAHAVETERLLRDPDAASESAVLRARREVALGRTRDAKG
jgi:HEAT repeat protein